MIWIGLLLALCMDRLTKLLSVQWLTLGEESWLIPHVVKLQLSHNNGMALGLFSDSPILIIALPIAAVVVGILVLRRYRLTSYTALAYGLILGGFLGNMIDRVQMGYVVDMIYFPFLPFFICNVADIAISAGVALIVISLFFRPQDWTPSKPKKDETHESAT